MKYLVVFLALVCTGCRTLRVGELRAEFGKSAYVRLIEAGNHEILVRFVPDLMWKVQGLGLEDSLRLSRSLLDSLTGDTLAGGLRFLLSIRPKGESYGQGFSRDVVYGSIGGFRNYQEALETYQFGFKERIWLESGGRRIPMANYHMENSFGMDPGRNFVLCFSDMKDLIGGDKVTVFLVLDDLVPGLSRRKVEWTLPVGKYDHKI